MVLANSYTIPRRFKTKTLVPWFLVLSTLFAMCDMHIFSCYVMQINLIFLLFFSTGVLSQLILIIIGTGSKRLKWLCNQRNSLAMRGDSIRSMSAICWDLTSVLFFPPPLIPVALSCFPSIASDYPSSL